MDKPMKKMGSFVSTQNVSSQKRSMISKDSDNDAEGISKKNELKLSHVLNIFSTNNGILNENTIDEISQPLCSIDFFKRSCPEGAKLEDFVRHSVHFLKFEQYKRGQAIFHYGESGDKFYIVLMGKVGVYSPRAEDQIKKDIESFIEQEQTLHHTHSHHYTQSHHHSARNISLKEQSVRSAQNIDERKVNMEEKKYIQQWERIKQPEQLETEALLLNSGNRRLYFQEHPFLVASFQKVFQFHSGGSFGEIALTTDQARTASIITMSDELYLLSMTKTDFKKLNERQIQETNNKINYFMKQFNGVSKQTVAKFINYFHELSFNTSTILWKQGDEPEFFFLIKQGGCELFRNVTDQRIPEKQQILSTFQSKSRRRKIILSTLGNDTFIGDDDIIEQLNQRSYSCKITEVTQAYYMTAYDFQNIRKIYPDIVKCLKEKYQLIQQYMTQRQIAIVQSQNQVQRDIQDLIRPVQKKIDRITVSDISTASSKISKSKDKEKNNIEEKNQLVTQDDKLEKREQVDILRSALLEQIPKLDIPEKNEELHNILMKRTQVQFGDQMKKDFKMIEQDVIDDIKDRIERRFNDQKGFQKKIDFKKSNTKNCDLLLYDLNKKKEKRATDNDLYQKSIQDLPLNCIRAVTASGRSEYQDSQSVKASKSYINKLQTLNKGGVILLSRALNPKHQSTGSIQKKMKIDTVSQFNGESTSQLFTDQDRIHSATPGYRKVGKRIHNFVASSSLCQSNYLSQRNLTIESCVYRGFLITPKSPQTTMGFTSNTKQKLRLPQSLYEIQK